jgi:hypothetical protein
MKKYDKLALALTECFVSCDDAGAFAIIQKAVRDKDMENLELATGAFVYATKTDPELLAQMGAAMIANRRMKNTRAVLPVELTHTDISRIVNQIIARDYDSATEDELATVIFTGALLAMEKMVDRLLERRNQETGINVPGNGAYRQ